jgi:hypothetical protein
MESTTWLSMNPKCLAEFGRCRGMIDGEQRS